jgi:adenine-specific DNA-methyltransferase
MVAKGPTAASYPKNPVVHRGQDPELFWLNKYGADDLADKLPVDIRSLYRHEHIQPEMLLPSLMRVVKTDADQGDLFGSGDFFTQTFGKTDELTKPGEYYYKHREWTNRLVQGDSLLVMSSLLEREGMAGQVQCIYLDPPYGIKYSGNWQLRINSKAMPDTDRDDALSGEPEQIKAFRDTWELGIHSYLSYLRDRLLVAKDLLHPSGSCFVQISDANLHLIRCLMDEVFGSEAHVVTIPVKKKGSQKSSTMAPVNDYVVWYARSPKENGQFTGLKMRKLFEKRELDGETLDEFRWVELLDGSHYPVSAVPDKSGNPVDYRLSPKLLFEHHKGARLFRPWPITNGGERPNQMDLIEFRGKKYSPPKGRCWSYRSNPGHDGVTPMLRLRDAKRLYSTGGALDGIRYLDDFPYKVLTNWWDGLGGTADLYVVETNTEIVKRCILMTTDPGDLVLDPTCGSGTTAYVAEQWGRRWLTCDTSRIAINIAKTRLMTSRFPYYRLTDQKTCDIRQGFLCRMVNQIDLGHIANSEPPPQASIYDDPEIDSKRLRIAGPFTVETLQNFEPVSPAALAAARKSDAEMGKFEDVVFEHLKSAGVKTGDKKENAVFHRIDRLADADLHAEGFYKTASGEAKAYLHIGPKFGTVSKQAVNNATKACRRRGDADWLIILGFSFESDIESKSVTTSQGQFQVTKVRMHDDLLQEGLLKKDKKAASFVTIGEPDIALKAVGVWDGKADGGDIVQIEIKGLDIYDPIKDEVKSRDVHDIAYWMVDTDYDGANFIVRQAFFCGGDKDEFAAWKKGLENLALLGAKKKAEKTLKIEIDEEAFARLYGHQSHPFPVNPGQQIAVRVISQFGEETTKVLTVK